MSEHRRVRSHHRGILGGWWVTCACGWQGPDFKDDRDDNPWAEHVKEPE